MSAGEHSGLTEKCFLILAMLGYPATVAEIREGFRREVGEDFTVPQIQDALKWHRSTRRPLMEPVSATRRGVPTRWRLTSHGHNVLLEDEREPCGTGWPG